MVLRRLSISWIIGYIYFMQIRLILFTIYTAPTLYIHPWIRLKSWNYADLCIKKRPQNERISMQVVKYSYFCCCYDIIWVSRRCIKYSNSATFDIWKTIHCLHIDVTCNISYVWGNFILLQRFIGKVDSHQSERVWVDDFILRGCVQCIQFKISAHYVI